MPAIHQDGQLDPVRPAQVHQGVQRGADRAPREQHVVDQHDLRAVHLEQDLGLADYRVRRGHQR